MVSLNSVAAREDVPVVLNKSVWADADQLALQFVHQAADVVGATEGLNSAGE
ncbi:hypothetical protein [Streptomyces malaysiensis]|uniref:hypothetical protein n=1 Tax=Streptomyces malaysiensis TaxID=92644 RepID=UPI0013566E8C|nr:hypothetical protein [Streptomyces sp. SPMA113]